MFISITVSNGYEQGRRRALSSIKKGVFLCLEGHVLEWRRACSRMEKGMFLNRGRGGMVFKYAFGLFISLHHDFLGSSFSHGGEFFLARRIFFFLTESIFLSHRGNLSLSQRVFLSLTELTDVTDLICAQCRTHRTPPAYRCHRGLSTNISCNALCYRLT